MSVSCDDGLSRHAVRAMEEEAPAKGARVEHFISAAHVYICIQATQAQLDAFQATALAINFLRRTPRPPSVLAGHQASACRACCTGIITGTGTITGTSTNCQRSRTLLRLEGRRNCLGHTPGYIYVCAW